MDSIQRDEKILELKRLIENKTMGTTQEFAYRLGVSRATLFRLLVQLSIREQRDIRYCRLRKYYIFKNND